MGIGRSALVHISPQALLRTTSASQLDVMRDRLASERALFGKQCKFSIEGRPPPTKFRSTSRLQTAYVG